MILTKTVIYTRVSSQSQDNQRQVLNLTRIADEKNWMVKRTFQEKVSGTTRANSRTEFYKMIQYIENNNIDLVMISEVSRIGRRVLDVLNSVDLLHKKHTGVFIQQFNIITFQDGKEDPIAKMLLQTLSIGAEMENSMRKNRQLEGIQLAKLNQKYKGRKNGAKADPTILLKKYLDVTELLKKSDLSLRRIAQITNHSINTVRKVSKLSNI